MSERNAREYLCWNNAYVRTLRELGVKAITEHAGPTLSEIIASRAPLGAP
jgi:hypothetical protein